ncbi:hypothetical protein SAMN04488508_107180 [Aquimarina spongiae]|uniref:Uncharacterized protein n=1 Tax=Aquimarina spongiae TaxID=570521 RepID=A0A1M6I8D0_9FLAO|nr:hypothetical protein SAMN04488508_107180 [Aquimarina spongiae]
MGFNKNDIGHTGSWDRILNIILNLFRYGIKIVTTLALVMSYFV